MAARRRSWFGYVLASLLASTSLACGGHVAVRSGIAPAAYLVRLRNFAILQPAGLARAASSSDPILHNPATIHVVSYELLLAFQARGYFADTAAADFDIAYYIASRWPVDTTVFAYGYSFEPYSWWQDDPKIVHPVQPDTEATVVVDVINPKTKAVLWRGEGTVRATADETRYEQGLRKVVDAIADQFQAGRGAGPIAPPPLEHGGRFR
jgi:hypothetical protein